MRVLEKLNEQQEELLTMLTEQMLDDPESVTAYEVEVSGSKAEFVIPKQSEIEQAYADAGRDADPVTREIRARRLILAYALRCVIMPTRSVEFTNEPDDMAVKRRLLGNMNSVMLDFLWSKFAIKRDAYSLLLYGKMEKLGEIVGK